MKKTNHNRELVALMIYIVLFGLILIASIVSYFKSFLLIDIGLPARTTNLIIAFMCVAGLVRAVWHAIHY